MADRYDFDIAAFNKKFEQVMEIRKKEANEENKKKLDLLNKKAIIPKKSKYEESIGEIILGIKNTVIDIGKELFDGKLDKTIVTKDHRMYYIGIMLIMIVIIYSIINILNQSYGK